MLVLFSLLISGEKETLLYHSLFDCCNNNDNNNIHVLSHLTRVSRCVKLTLHIHLLRETPAHFDILVRHTPSCVSILQIRVLVNALMSVVFDTVGGDLFCFCLLLLLF